MCIPSVIYHHHHHHHYGCYWEAMLQQLTMGAEHVCRALILGIIQKVDAPVYSKAYAAHGQAYQA